jgi:hypothetical protein
LAPIPEEIDDREPAAAIEPAKQYEPPNKRNGPPGLDPFCCSIRHCDLQNAFVVVSDIELSLEVVPMAELPFRHVARDSNEQPLNVAESMTTLNDWAYGGLMSKLYQPGGSVRSVRWIIDVP